MYFDVYPNSRLEEYAKEYSELLETHGEKPLSVSRLDSVEDVLKVSDVRVSPHFIPEISPGWKEDRRRHGLEIPPSCWLSCAGGCLPHHGLA